MRDLILIHGRAQQDKDAQALKDSWIEAWRRGLAKSGLNQPISHEKIHFPYYGDTLRDLAKGGAGGKVAEIIVKGDDAEDEEREFIRQYILELQRKLGIDEDEILAEGGDEVVQKGPQNWEWLHSVLKVVDRRFPGASGASVALATRDVYKYLRNPGIQTIIDSGVRQAFAGGGETVVVSHSLGTVVAYNLIRREGTILGWQIPLFITLGSPLAIKVIRTSLAPLRHPDCVGDWFNAMDERDVVALYPLTSKNFAITPPITNKTDVSNHTANRHGIEGYLDDAEVAKRIYDAVI